MRLERPGPSGKGGSVGGGWMRVWGGGWMRVWGGGWMGSGKGRGEGGVGRGEERGEWGVVGGGGGGGVEDSKC